MTAADRQFGKALGRCLAALRRDGGLTQHGVAAHLGIAQQTIAHYEVGRLRLPVVFVPTLAALFGVSTDTLLGVGKARSTARARKRGPTPKLQRQLERLRRLPKAQQHVVLTQQAWPDRSGRDSRNMLTRHACLTGRSRNATRRVGGAYPHFDNLLGIDEFR